MRQYLQEMREGGTLLKKRVRGQALREMCDEAAYTRKTGDEFETQMYCDISGSHSGDNDEDTHLLDNEASYSRRRQFSRN
jgi:hypothetical protein